MFDILPKKFRLSITTEKRNLIFDFSECDFRRCLEIEKIIKEEGMVALFLFDFLNEHGEISKQEFSKIPQEKFSEILKFVLEKHSGGYFSFDKKNKGKGDNAPSSAWVVIFLEKCCKSLDDLLKMRWREIIFLMDGLVWNANEMTDEGKRRNKMKVAFEELNNF